MRTSSKAPDSAAACRYRLPPRHPLHPRPHDVRREGRQSPRPETCRKRRRTKLLVRIHETGAGSPRSRDSRQKRTVGLWLSRRRRVIRLRCLHRTPLLVFDAPAAGGGRPWRFGNWKGGDVWLPGWRRVRGEEARGERSKEDERGRFDRAGGVLLGRRHKFNSLGAARKQTRLTRAVRCGAVRCRIRGCSMCHAPLRADSTKSVSCWMHPHFHRVRIRGHATHHPAVSDPLAAYQIFLSKQIKHQQPAFLSQQHA
jgi:hypothetical protein